MKMQALAQATLMAELKLGKRIDRDYGARYEATVTRDDGGVVKGTYREPRRPDRATAAYVLATGLFGGKNSMRLPALVGAKVGHISLALEYSNQGFGHALDADARDIASGLEALPDELLKRVVALSKAGRTTTRALARTQAHVQAATVVVPAGYIKDNHMSWREGVERIAALGPEVAQLALAHPLQAAWLGAGCVKNTLSRAGAVFGECHELRDGNEHNNLHIVKARPDAPFIRFVYGTGDMVLPAELQCSSIEGLPLDEIRPYRGGHIDLTTNPAIAATIYAADALLEPPRADYPYAQAA